MRRAILALSAVCLLSALVHPVQADEKAKAVIDKAIQAVGGEAKLAKFNAANMKIRATEKRGGNEVVMDMDLTMQGLDRIRWEVEIERMGMRMTALFVFNGDQAWGKQGDKVEDLPPEVLTEFKKLLSSFRVVQTLGTLKDKAVTSTLLGESKVGERPAVGIRLSRPNDADTDLFFDKETGLLLRLETKMMAGPGAEGTLEILYADYKEIGGIKHFSKLTLKRTGGERMDEMEAELNELKPLEKVDEGLFARP